MQSSFQGKGIRTAAFISSQTGTIGPWDINDGLPTLEMHRKMPVETAAKHLFATGLIDDVIIGNAYASEAELAALGAIDRYQTAFAIEFVPEINEVERQIALDEQHYRRGDITDRMIRSTEVRKSIRTMTILSMTTKASFNEGRCDRQRSFWQVQNELQVVLEPHQIHEK